MSWRAARRRAWGLLATATAAAALYHSSQAFLSSAGCSAQSKSRCSAIARRAAPPDLALEVGDLVKARAPDDRVYYFGRLRSANADGTWVVAWRDPDGGPETDTLQQESIRKIQFAKDYCVGDDCMAVAPEDQFWYPGVVAKVLGQGRFLVKWDDPDGGPETANVHFEEMRRQIVKRDYEVGDKVLAVYPEDGEMYPAVVVRKFNGETFRVKWDDADGGPEESDVGVKSMRVPPIPFASLEVGQKHKGTVRRILDFGAFVDIGAESEGLLHISQISEYKVENVHDHLQQDQEIDCWISDVQKLDSKFSLTLQERKADTGGVGGRTKLGWQHDLTPFAELNEEDFYDGKVVSVKSFGAFVLVTLPSGDQAEGLVHASQIKTGFVDDVAAEVSLGQDVKVRVRRVDLNSNKMQLSMRAVGDHSSVSQDVSPFAGVDSKTWLSGRVVRTLQFGAFVCVTSPDGKATAEGLLHIGQILDVGYVEDVRDELQVGLEVRVRPISVDVETGKIGLSMRLPGSSGPPGRSPFTTKV